MQLFTIGVVYARLMYVVRVVCVTVFWSQYAGMPTVESDVRTQVNYMQYPIDQSFQYI